MYLWEVILFINYLVFINNGINSLNICVMKRLLFCACLIMTCLFPTISIAQTIVLQRDALSIAKKQFVGKDVDYYILSNSSSPVWKIFVDAEPMKGWQHDCYILTIPKSTTSNISDIVPHKEFRKMPPTENYAPLSVKNRYGVNANSKPRCFLRS